MTLIITLAAIAFVSCSERGFYKEGVIENVNFHDVCPSQQPAQSVDDYNLSISLDENLDHCRITSS